MLSAYFSWFYLVVVFADLIVYNREPSWADTWDFWFGLFYIPLALLTAAWFFARQEWWGGTIFTVFAIGHFIFWWTNGRRRRKKIADKASGIVTDVGGRLKVVREPTSET